MGEVAAARENPVAKPETIADPAIRAIDSRISKLNEQKREVANRIVSGVLGTALTLGVILNAGCGNTEARSFQTPAVPTEVKGASPPASTTAPEIKITASPTAESTNLQKPIPTAEIKPTSTSTPANEAIRELSKDIIPDQELASKYNTHIWNLPDIKMHLRQGIVGGEKSLFEWLQHQDEETKLALSESKTSEFIKERWRRPRGLDIVLVDGPYVDSKFLTEVQRKGLSRDTIKALQELVDELKIKHQGSSQQAFLGGAYLSTHLAEIVKPDGTKAIEVKKAIFIAVKDYTAKIPQGNETTLRQVFTPSSSYPQGSDFVTTSHPEYPIGYGRNGDNIFWIARHEFAHASGKDHPQTDIAALSIIKNAEEARKGGDDSLYYLEFEVKGKNGQPNKIYIGQNNMTGQNPGA